MKILIKQKRERETKVLELSQRIIIGKRKSDSGGWSFRA